MPSGKLQIATHYDPVLAAILIWLYRGQHPHQILRKLVTIYRVTSRRKQLYGWFKNLCTNPHEKYNLISKSNNLLLFLLMFYCIWFWKLSDFLVNKQQLWGIVNSYLHICMQLWIIFLTMRICFHIWKIEITDFNTFVLDIYVVYKQLFANWNIRCMLPKPQIYYYYVVTKFFIVFALDKYLWLFASRNIK